MRGNINIEEAFGSHLGGYIRRNVEINMILFGISRFSEINEMHGYHFSNRVLEFCAKPLQIEQFMA